MDTSLSPHAYREHRARVGEAEQELEHASEAYGLLVGVGAPQARIERAGEKMDAAAADLRALGVIG
jgi:hypothetical protein